MLVFDYEVRTIEYKIIQNDDDEERENSDVGSASQSVSQSQTSERGMNGWWLRWDEMRGISSKKQSNRDSQVENF